MFPYGGSHYSSNICHNYGNKTGTYTSNASASARAERRARDVQERAEKRAKKLEERARGARYLPDEVDEDDFDFEPEGWGSDYAHAYYQREMERGRREGERRGREMDRELERMGREFERAAEERQRELERARKERERARAQIQGSSLHVPELIRSTSRSRSRSTSQNRKDNSVDVTLNLDNLDSNEYSACLVDLLNNHAAIPGTNVNIHVNANSGLRRDIHEPPAQTYYDSLFGVPNPTSGRPRRRSHSSNPTLAPNPGHEVSGRPRGRSHSPNPTLAPNPMSNENRKPSPSPARATASAFASSSAFAPTPATAAKHTRAPSPNPAPKQLKKAYDILAEVKTQFEKLSKKFVFPSAIDFQELGEKVVSVNVTRSVEEIVAASVTQDNLMEVDVDLAESPIEENTVPKLAYTPTNFGLLNYLDSLDKLIIRLDGVESRGDEGVRLSRRKLVKEIGSEVERVERFWTGVWKGEEERVETISEETLDDETENETEVTIEIVPDAMQDGLPTPQSSPEPTLTIEPPVEDMNAMQTRGGDESPVHVEMPDSAAAFTSDVKVDHKDHAATTEPEDWVDVAVPSASAPSAHADDKAAEAKVPSGVLDADMDLDDEPPSYEQSMSVTFVDGRPDQVADVQGAGEEENLETSTSTLRSMSEKDKKIEPPRGQLHVVNGDGEQDAEWVPVSAKGL